MGGEAVDALAGEPDLALEGDAAFRAPLHALLEAHQAGNRPEQRRLAGAVRADQTDQLAFVDLQRDAVQDLRPVVAHAEVFHLKQRHARPRDRLR
jgi:hypothetical protein